MAETQGSWDPQVDMQSYYEAAAVLDAFDPFTWQPALGPRPDGSLPGPLTSDVREALLEKLLIDCEQILEGPLHGLWRLTHSARRGQLRRLATREAMRAALAMTAERPSSPAQRMFEQLLSGEPPAIEEMARDDLAAMISVRGWLEGIVDDLPARGELSMALARADLLAPMHRLLRHGFVNREQELAQLSAYVNGDAGARREAPLFVYGSGGVGKSTLLARFILALVQESGRCFAYVDIDRPTISPDEPLTILLEIISQLQAQLNFDALSRNDLVYAILNEMSREEKGHVKEALSSDSGYAFHIDRLGKEMLRATASDQAEAMPPVLIVDTFEEAQWFGRGTVIDLLDLLFALHNSGLFRVVISGRVLPDEFLDGAFPGQLTLPPADAELLQEELAAIPLPERPLNVNVLDEEASRELLAVAVAQASLPPLSAEEQTDIINIVTRNPMCLKLAARLLQTEGIEKLRETRRLFLAQLKAEKIQALLYGRILNHIKKHDVRQVAYPGLVVRRITPEVIREVLAVPCKLTLTAERNEEDIFKDMRREAALVVFDSTDQSLRHRPDVRRAMLLDLTDHVDEETVAAIDLAAVTYYARFDDPVSRAEEIYHRLRRHEPGGDLDARWLPEAARYLKDAGQELPATQRLWLARWLNITLDDDVRQEADQEAWEDQAARSAERYLASADAWTALKVLEEREERLPRSRLYDLHAEAYRILGAHDRALEIGREGVDALIEAGDLGQALDLLLKMVVIEESREHLAEADSLLYEAENVSRRGGDRVKALRAQIARLRIERKLRPEAEARQNDLRRAALAGLNGEMRLALRSHPVLLRETAAELALYDPELAAAAIERLGLETTRAQERTQGSMLGHVLDVLYGQAALAGESEADDAAFLERWRSSDHDPIVVEDWVRARGKALVDRLARSARESESGSDLLSAVQDYFRAGESIVLEDVGKTYQKGGRSADAQKIYLQTLETMRRSGDRDGEARTLSNLAEIARIESRPDEALSLLQEALAIWRDVGERAEEARTLYDYAALLLVLRRYDEAGEPFREALAIFRQLGDRERVAMTLRSLAVLNTELGDPDKALAYFEKVLAIYRELGDRRMEAGTLVIMAGTLRENGRAAEAHEALDAALAIMRALGDRSAEADTLVELAAVAEAEGHPGEALRFYEDGLQIMRDLGSGDREQWVLKEMERLGQQTDGAKGAGGDELSAGSPDPGEGVATGQSPSTEDVQRIYRRLVDLFNVEELRDLCFFLGLDYEDLGGATKSAKARELVLYMRRRDRLDELIKAIIEMRPGVEW